MTFSPWELKCTSHRLEAFNFLEKQRKYTVSGTHFIPIKVIFPAISLQSCFSCNISTFKWRVISGKRNDFQNWNFDNLNFWEKNTLFSRGKWAQNVDQRSNTVDGISSFSNFGWIAKSGEFLISGLVVVGITSRSIITNGRLRIEKEE